MVTKTTGRHPTKAELEAWLDTLPKLKRINPSSGCNCFLAAFFRDVRNVKAFCMINSYGLEGDSVDRDYRPIQRWAKNAIGKAMDLRDERERKKAGVTTGYVDPSQKDGETDGEYNHRRGITVKQFQTILMTA